MRDYTIELEIYAGNAGELRTDGSRPDFAREGSGTVSVNTDCGGTRARRSTQLPRSPAADSRGR